MLAPIAHLKNKREVQKERKKEKKKKKKKKKQEEKETNAKRDHIRFANKERTLYEEKT
jgi:hypothetical protein